MDTATFIYYTIPEIGGRKRKKIYNFELSEELKAYQDYCVNGDYILLKYESFQYTEFGYTRHEELWHMMDPSPMQIELPNLALFFGENEYALLEDFLGRLGNGWIMDTNKNSQFSVRPCKREISESHIIESRQDFVLVFSLFDAPKYLHRISAMVLDWASSGWHKYDIHMTVVGENVNAKTLLMVDCDKLGYNELGENQEMRAFDLSTGQVLFSRRYGEHSSFVCSQNTTWHSLYDIDFDRVEAKLLWTNWNGKDWSISEKVVPLPIIGNETTLKSVTDTRILWHVEGEKGRTDYYFSYDYLLPDIEGSLLNTDKSTWLDNFHKEDCRMSESDTEEEDD